MTLTIIKFIFLLIGIWFSIVNMGRMKSLHQIHFFKLWELQDLFSYNSLCKGRFYEILSGSFYE